MTFFRQYRYVLLVMGLLVSCLGVWLLLRRLAGQADHFHLPGHGHHHHHGTRHHHDHGHADHTHDEHGNVVPRPVSGSRRKRNVTATNPSTSSRRR